MPLPLWNRNRGAIEEAGYRLAKLAEEQRSARVAVATELATARVALVAAVEESQLLHARVLPGVERAVDVMRRGYEQGRFAQLEVLDAERLRVAAREQYLSALVEAQHSARKIERLTGVPLEVRP
jgi:cobalt-zinc-cadmium efflux system outer membrane protein